MNRDARPRAKTLDALNNKIDELSEVSRAEVANLRCRVLILVVVDEEERTG